MIKSPILCKIILFSSSILFGLTCFSQTDKQITQLKTIIKDAKNGFVSFRGRVDTVTIDAQDSSETKWIDPKHRLIDQSEQETIMVVKYKDRQKIQTTYYIDFPFVDSKDKAIEVLEKWKTKLQTSFKEDAPHRIYPNGKPEYPNSFDRQIAQKPAVYLRFYYLESRKKPGTFRPTLVVDTPEL